MKIRLVDGCFFPREQSATLAGERSGEGPASFAWSLTDSGPVTFYTDICLHQVADQPGRKVAWLLEPPWKPSAYEQALRLQDQFEFILTYRAGMGNKALFYPLGGSWLVDWDVYDKHELVSLMVSERAESEGHQLRHQIANSLPIADHTYGRGTREIESKADALRHYYYSIVVESWRGNWYFSEKLIDCLSQGTVPIYWGCPDIGRFFDEDGIISFTTLTELDYILAYVVNVEDYARRLPAIRYNLEVAREYACAEDWIYQQYPFLFEG